MKPSQWSGYLNDFGCVDCVSNRIFLETGSDRLFSDCYLSAVAVSVFSQTLGEHCSWDLCVYHIPHWCNLECHAIRVILIWCMGSDSVTQCLHKYSV